MQEFSYKGFKVIVEITNHENADYQANALCYAKGDANPLPQQFQTLSDSKLGVKNEIKRMVKQYIDFERKEFLKMKGERHKESLYHPQSH